MNPIVDTGLTFPILLTSSTHTGMTSLGSFPFSDIADSFAKDYITALYGSGIVHGYDDGTFRPDTPVSRIEFLKMVMVKTGRYDPATAI